MAKTKATAKKSPKQRDMKLIVQPDDGGDALLKGINDARTSVEIMVFRFGHKEVERALMKAIQRGVAVQALIAFTNRGGEKVLRDLETRLLDAGATVARTSNELVRYHGKYMIVDRSSLYVLGFNFTKADIEHSRSFGIVTTDRQMVDEAGKLFLADCNRQSYAAECPALVVSPMNARQALGDFIQGAKKELAIFDLEVSDPAMLRILKERVESGVEVRVIGTLKGATFSLPVRASHPHRLHARVIVRDRSEVFIGSQSLRRVELDLRRELGILVRDAEVAKRVADIFDADWETAKADGVPADKVAKRIAKAVTKSMPPMSEVLESLTSKDGQSVVSDPENLERIVKDAVKNAVREAVQEAVAEDPAL